MPKKYTTESFIELSREKHGDVYDYSRTVYEKMNQKVIIICQEHGPFEQKPNRHLKGSGCRRCKVGCNTEQFIERATKVHNRKYTYENVEFKTMIDRVSITCPEHGNFEQRPNKHLQGSGCSACSKTRKYNTRTFIEKANLIHGNKYTYEKTNYVNSRTKVIITCPIHGEFSQLPDSHVRARASGCTHCQ